MFLLLTNPYVAEKREAAQKAEADFFALLKETKDIEPHSTWKEVRLLQDLKSSPLTYYYQILFIRSRTKRAFIKIPDTMLLGRLRLEKNYLIPS